MTRTRRSASSGRISGSGFAMAKTIGSRAIRLMSLTVRIPGTDRPMKTAAPSSASPSVPLTWRGFVAKPPLALEAAGRGDVLGVDAAEGRRNELDGLDDLVDILRRKADRERVHAPEFFEQHRLAPHPRQGRLGPDVAEAQDRRAVGDDGDRVLLDRQRERKLSVVADRQADAGDPGRVRHREVVTRADRDLVAYLDLPAEVHQEGPVGDVPDADARDVTEPAHDLLGVNAVARLDGDVAQGPLTRGLDEVDRADIPARFADGGRDAAQHARAVGDLQADREAVGGTRCLHPPPSTPSA